MNNTFKLGRSLVQILPFHIIPIKKQEPAVAPKKELITTKLIIVMAIIAIVKIAVLMLWI